MSKVNFRRMTNTSKPVFGGLSNVDMEISEFDLGQGILLRKTYAHLFAANMLAFKVLWGFQ